MTVAAESTLNIYLSHPGYHRVPLSIRSSQRDQGFMTIRVLLILVFAQLLEGIRVLNLSS